MHFLKESLKDRKHNNDDGRNDPRMIWIFFLQIIRKKDYRSFVPTTKIQVPVFRINDSIF